MKVKIRQDQATTHFFLVNKADREKVGMDPDSGNHVTEWRDPCTRIASPQLLEYNNIIRIFVNDFGWELEAGFTVEIDLTEEQVKQIFRIS
jgi:hypothetical protein